MGKSNRIIHWQAILKLIVTELPSKGQLFYDDSIFHFQYIADPQTRLGFLLIWEVDSMRAINISRIKVPENVQFIDINDESAFANSIPKNLLIESMD